MLDKVTVPKIFQTLTPNVDFKEIPRDRYRDCIFQLFFSKERIKAKNDFCIMRPFCSSDP